MAEQEKPNDDNVIPFPKKEKPEERKPTLFWDGNLRTAGLSAIMFSVLLLGTMVNYSLMVTKSEDTFKNKGLRGLASITKLNTGTDVDTIRSLASNEAEVGTRLGRTPSNEENLRFSQLSGLYSLKFDQGKIRSIAFSSDESTSPKFVNDRANFLKKNRGLFSIDYSEVRFANKESNGPKDLEYYHLVDNSNSIVGTVKIELDKFGRFISMKVDKAR